MIYKTSFNTYTV